MKITIVVTAVYELPKENTEINPDFLSKQYANSYRIRETDGEIIVGCFFYSKRIHQLKCAPESSKRYFYSGKISYIGYECRKISELYGPNDVEFTRLDKMKLHTKASWFAVGIISLFLFYSAYLFDCYSCQLLILLI
jgi:putative ABC transport system permease protein